MITRLPSLCIPIVPKFICGKTQSYFNFQYMYYNLDTCNYLQEEICEAKLKDSMREMLELSRNIQNTGSVLYHFLTIIMKMAVHSTLLAILYRF